MFTEQFEVLSKSDQAWINPAMALVMIIILAFSFRSVTGTLVPWVLIGSAITLVTGIQGLMRWPTSPKTKLDCRNRHAHVTPPGTTGWNSPSRA